MLYLNNKLYSHNHAAVGTNFGLTSIETQCTFVR